MSSWAAEASFHRQHQGRYLSYHRERGPIAVSSLSFFSVEQGQHVTVARRPVLPRPPARAGRACSAARDRHPHHLVGGALLGAALAAASRLRDVSSVELVVFE